MTITANAEPTEIEADVDKRFSSIVVNLPVQQTGTGTPSPTNPRPFTVWTDVSLYVSDTEEADEPTLSIQLPTPLYGGKIDMVRGEIATTYNSKESGTGWEMTQEGQFRCQVSAYNNGDETSTNVADLYAVHYETVSNKDAYDATDDLTCGLATIDGTTYLYVNDAQYTTLESFATHIAEEVFVFRAHIPMSDVTEPHIVYLPEGTSYVWADAGFVDYTVSGTPPLSLPNSLGKPLKAWSVDVLPKQDLNGYDSPWPAGGGANQFDALTWVTLGSNANYYTVSANESITITGEDTGGIGNRLIDIDPDVQYSFMSTFAQSIRIFSSNAQTLVQSRNGTFTAPSDGKIAVKFYASAYPTTGQFILVKGSTIPATWSPYANLCPIHGTDKLNLFVEESYDQSATPKAVITLPSTVYTATIGSSGGESRDVVHEFDENLLWQTWGVNNLVQGITGFYFYRTNTPTIDFANINIAVSTNWLPINNRVWGGGAVGYYTNNANVNPAAWYEMVGIENSVAGIEDTDTAQQAVDKFKAYLTNNSLQVRFSLVTNVQFPLTATPIPTPTGTATTWATAEDGTVDSMEVTYVGKA